MSRGLTRQCVTHPRVIYRCLGYGGLALLMMLQGCTSTGARNTRIYQAGEKASVDKLTYAVIDTQIYTRLGDDPNNPRIPQNRFYAVQVAVSNGDSTDAHIPGMTLVDDSGKTYHELPDGTGVQHWFGVVRRVAPAQTEQGAVLFDAPAAHYKLKLTEDADPEDVYIDIPLSFVHEQLRHDPVLVPEAAGAGQTPMQLPLTPPKNAPKK